MKKTLVFACCLMALLATAQQKIIVSQDGQGNYKTVQEALYAVTPGNTSPVIIYIRNGVYREKLYMDPMRRHVTLVGEDRFNTILSWNDHTGKMIANGDTVNTRSSWSFLIKADDFAAQDITFQNDAGFSAGQAVAVESDGDRAVFRNCRFVGNQDVLFTNNENSRQYFEHCYIEGTTDFIFGSATAWFEQCHIHSKKNSNVTAASTPKEHLFGYVFHDCILTGDTSIHNASLGRPWRPYAAVAYIHCYIGAHIRTEGWANWNNTDNFKTARYSEYASYGPEADAAGRVAWAKQLTREEARQYSLKNVLKGWNPVQ